MEHPFWGYRRICAYQRFVELLSVNKKRWLHLMREHQLPVAPNLKLKAKRTPTESKPKPTRPNEWWGIDMTKGLVQGFGCAYIVVVLHWYTKMIVGDYVRSRCTSRNWLSALNIALNRQFPEGARGRPCRR